MICLRRIGVLFVAALLVLGCDSNSDSKRFFPNESSARETLETALNNWKNGGAPGQIDDHKPPIVVVDSARKPGQRLASFEIGGEDTTTEGHHRFAVKLTLLPGGMVQTHYVVYGQSPLWVQREEDYAKLSGEGK
jgi:hypothetical protein